MKRVLTHLAMTALPCLSFGAAQAADSRGMYQTLYYLSCESYVQHRKEPAATGNNAIAQIYVSGWMTGFNYLTPNTYNILSKDSVLDIMKQVDAYCAKNPKMNVDAALLQITSELYPTRIKEFVQPGTEAAAPAAAAAAPQAVDATGTASQKGLEQGKFTFPQKAKPAEAPAATATAKAARKAAKASATAQKPAE